MRTIAVSTRRWGGKTTTAINLAGSSRWQDEKRWLSTWTLKGMSPGMLRRRPVGQNMYDVFVHHRQRAENRPVRHH